MSSPGGPGGPSNLTEEIHMSNISTRRARGAVAGIALALLAGGAVACGDDTDDAAASNTTAAAETPDNTDDTSDEEGTADTAEFCTAFTDLDSAFHSAPGDDPEALVPFVQQEVLPPLEIVRETQPDEIAEHVTVMTDAIDKVAEAGDWSGFESEAFAEATGVVYPWVADNCEVQSVEATAIDFAYEGIPDQLDAGVTLFTLDNQSPAGEAHELAFARIHDDVELGLHELLALPMEELESKIDLAGGVFAMPGDTSGITLDLTPGRWAYVCLIPTGSVDGAEGDGPPHVAHGMSGEFTVG
jgi:hypothetical protein